MTRSNKMVPEIPEVCPHCYFGRILPGKRTFSSRANGKPMMVPDFPAWICDVCGFTIYDPTSLLNLQRLLTNPAKSGFRRTAPKPNEPISAKPQPQGDQPG